MIKEIVDLTKIGMTITFRICDNCGKFNMKVCLEDPNNEEKEYQFITCIDDNEMDDDKFLIEMSDLAEYVEAQKQ